MSVFRETLCSRIKYRDLCTNFLSWFFDISKYVFLVIRSICIWGWEPNWISICLHDTYIISSRVFHINVLYSSHTKCECNFYNKKLGWTPGSTKLQCGDKCSWGLVRIEKIDCDISGRQHSKILENAICFFFTCTNVFLYASNNCVGDTILEAVVYSGFTKNTYKIAYSSTPVQLVTRDRKHTIHAVKRLEIIIKHIQIDKSKESKSNCIIGPKWKIMTYNVTWLLISRVVCWIWVWNCFFFFFGVFDTTKNHRAERA